MLDVPILREQIAAFLAAEFPTKAEGLAGFTSLLAKARHYRDIAQLEGWGCQRTVASGSRVRTNPYLYSRCSMVRKARLTTELSVVYAAWK